MRFIRVIHTTEFGFEPNLYRVRFVDTGEVVEFTVADEIALTQAGPKDPGSQGGAATPSAAEIAAELSNPNTALGTLNTNFDFIKYQDSLPGADGQSATKITFQPSLPYPMGGGTNFFVRPAIPVIIDQPVSGASGFEDKGVELVVMVW